MILKEYLTRLETAMPIMEARGDNISTLRDHYNSLKAIYPNKETYIDLHEVYTKEAELPIYPLYLKKWEVYALQTVGYVPDEDTDVYERIMKNFYD